MIQQSVVQQKYEVKNQCKLDYKFYWQLTRLTVFMHLSCLMLLFARTLGDRSLAKDHAGSPHCDRVGLGWQS